MSGFLNPEQLKEALNLPSVRTVNTLRRRRKIPAIRLGYRTYLYDLDACRAALEKLTVKAVW